MNLTGEGGKGSARRKGANDQAYKDNFDAIFGKKLDCPKCGSQDVHSIWIEPEHALPECEWCECYACEHEWNECAR